VVHLVADRLAGRVLPERADTLHQRGDVPPLPADRVEERGEHLERLNLVEKLGHSRQQPDPVADEEVVTHPRERGLNQLPESVNFEGVAQQGDQIGLLLSGELHGAAPVSEDGFEVADEALAQRSRISPRSLIIRADRCAQCFGNQRSSQSTERADAGISSISPISKTLGALYSA
jgi:hypothetical protein